MNSALFFPCFALLLLTAFVLLYMFMTRVNALKNKIVKMSYFKTYSSSVANLPDHMLQASRNFTNLFEVPTLFYMVCLFITVLNQVDTLLLVFAWLYVFFRICHTCIHLTSNNVRIRMTFYGLSWLVLVMMSFRLALKLMFLNFF